MKFEHMREQNKVPSQLCINPTEAAGQLHISRTKMYELLRQNVIPHVRLGRRILIPTKELERWLHEQSDISLAQKEGDVYGA